MKSKKYKKVNGNNIIYHYLQKNLISDNDEFTKRLIEKLILDLSIWLPYHLFMNMPIIFPYAIRDSSCRKSVNNINEEWGSANSKGFFRDDNSLIKGIIKSHNIKSSKIDQYNGKRLGVGFVACHIWREITIEGKTTLASGYHKTYSFIPNLVWLPNQISKLTDREGSYAQKVLQNVSRKIYFESTNDKEIEKIWNLLPDPYIDIRVNTKSLNYFQVSDEWINKRKNQIINEIKMIKNTIYNKKNDKYKVKCSRYLPSIVEVNNKNQVNLSNWLDQYKNMLN